MMRVRKKNQCQRFLKMNLPTSPSKNQFLNLNMKSFKKIQKKKKSMY